MAPTVSIGMRLQALDFHPTSPPLHKPLMCSGSTFRSPAAKILLSTGFAITQAFFTLHDSVFLVVACGYQHLTYISHWLFTLE